MISNDILNKTLFKEILKVVHKRDSRGCMYDKN